MHILARNRVFRRILRENWCAHPVDDWKNQKKTKNSREKGVRIIAHTQKRNLLSDLYNIFAWW